MYDYLSVFNMSLRSWLFMWQIYGSTVESITSSLHFHGKKCICYWHEVLHLSELYTEKKPLFVGTNYFSELILITFSGLSLKWKCRQIAFAPFECPFLVLPPLLVGKCRAVLQGPGSHRGASEVCVLRMKVLWNSGKPVLWYLKCILFFLCCEFSR